MLGHLGGAEFKAPKGPASEIARKLKDWSNPVCELNNEPKSTGFSLGFRIGS